MIRVMLHYNKEELKLACADYILNDSSELDEILRGL